MASKQKCILVCAGDFVPVDLEKENGDLLIAVDGGLKYLEQMGILPDHILGDFDSLEERYMRIIKAYERERRESVTRLPVRKDDTDSHAAVKLGLSRGYKRFYIYGGLGGRLDMTLANIQTLRFIKDHGGKGYLLGDRQMVMVLRDETIHFHESFTGQFSIFAMDERVEGVTIEGMKYELKDGILESSYPLGVSNEKEAGKRATITVGKGTALVVSSWK
ncbi:MAG: thiamine diphosphokinase [Lachnospiraceae bacterium]|nr:thiamine diphosphokinase [Lachnospiraceae bacterium]